MGCSSTIVPELRPVACPSQTATCRHQYEATLRPLCLRSSQTGQPPHLVAACVRSLVSSSLVSHAQALSQQVLQAGAAHRRLTWATAGSMSSVLRMLVSLSSMLRRLSPANASSVASTTFSFSLRRRVCTLPRKLTTCKQTQSPAPAEDGGLVQSETADSLVQLTQAGLQQMPWSGLAQADLHV